MEAITLGSVAPGLRDTLQQFAGEVAKLAGDKLLGITLFGSALQGAAPVGRHVARTAIVLSVIDLDMLRQLAPFGDRYGKAGLAAPRILTPELIRESCDTFPLELMEIEQLRYTLRGADHFRELEFEHADVRLECERELKSVQYGMHQAVLRVAGRDYLAELEQHVAATLLRVMRGILWLETRHETQAELQIVEQIETLWRRPMPALRHALNPEGTHTWEQIVALYREVGSLRDFVDEWQT